MNPTPTALLDLLRMAIIRCGIILQNPQGGDAGTLVIQVAPGPMPLVVKDPSAVRFLFVMRKEEVDLGFQLEPQGEGSQQLVLWLSQGGTQVAVPVARATPVGVGAGMPLLAMELNLRGILLGLSQALSNLRCPATVRPQPLQAGQAHGWDFRQVSGT